ncbi:hypothetical protein [Nocardia stercoris]|uniref:Uncharacterized protein n=1 Tax=Nocardia stercoris TaxID=2483361 RepID=A0A3M2L7E1_9NOCA|nr:hypothetical protein [Nocardia stercoris]RMI33612.1 hypothetical protein EBN03_10965 [Nocardia stercoris]
MRLVKDMAEGLRSRQVARIADHLAESYTGPIGRDGLLAVVGGTGEAEVTAAAQLEHVMDNAGRDGEMLTGRRGGSEIEQADSAGTRATGLSQPPRSSLTTTAERSELAGQRGLCSPPPDRATIVEARRDFELELRQRFGEHATYEEITARDRSLPVEDKWLEIMGERWPLLRQYAVVDWHIEGIAASLGRPSAEVREQMRRELTAAVAGKPIGIRVREKELTAILGEGRMRGSRNPFGERADAEAQWFGSHVHDNPPVYGFVAVEGVRPSQDGLIDGLSELNYGDHQIFLKPEVESRTTITVGDSLAEKDRTIPSPLNGPSEYSYLVGKGDPPIGRDYGGVSFRSNFFVEAQMFDLTTSDIDFIALHQAPGPELRQALDRSGTAWRILTNHTIAAEGSPAERAAAIERTSQDLEHVREVMRSKPHLYGVSRLRAQLSTDLRALNDSVAEGGARTGHVPSPRQL